MKVYLIIIREGFILEQFMQGVSKRWTDASLGTNISSLRGNTLVPYPQNYTGYFDASQNLT
jgi:hypothetical protein